NDEVGAVFGRRDIPERQAVDELTAWLGHVQKSQTCRHAALGVALPRDPCRDARVRIARASAQEQGDLSAGPERMRGRDARAIAGRSARTAARNSEPLVTTRWRTFKSANPRAASCRSTLELLVVTIVIMGSSRGLARQLVFDKNAK